MATDGSFAETESQKYRTEHSVPFSFHIKIVWSFPPSWNNSVSMLRATGRITEVLFSEGADTSVSATMSNYFFGSIQNPVQWVLGTLYPGVKGPQGEGFLYCRA
jgi:hypothetical protein